MMDILYTHYNTQKNHFRIVDFRSDIRESCVWMWDVMYRAIARDVITFEVMKTENSRHFVARDRSFYGDLHKMSDILLMC